MSVVHTCEMLPGGDNENITVAPRSLDSPRLAEHTMTHILYSNMLHINWGHWGSQSDALQTLSLDTDLLGLKLHTAQACTDFLGPS